MARAGVVFPTLATSEPAPVVAGPEPAVGWLASISDVNRRDLVRELEDNGACDGTESRRQLASSLVGPGVVESLEPSPSADRCL